MPIWIHSMQIKETPILPPLTSTSHDKQQGVYQVIFTKWKCQNYIIQNTTKKIPLLTSLSYILQENEKENNGKLW